MILLIDNYDSFSYNLVQMIGTYDEVRVFRNDQITVEEVRAYAPTHLILSPGPGRPWEAGISEDLIRAMEGKTRILGVCLGHQAICEVYGGNITYAKQLMHGKQSEVELDLHCSLFQGLQRTETVGRYHSLVAEPSRLPEILEVVAMDARGEIMAVQHKTYAIYGVQFHPESVLTPHGKQMMHNFLSTSSVVHEGQTIKG